MKTPILFATSNSHKLNEAQEILADWKVLSLKDFPQLLTLHPKETGATFEENAHIKAIAYGAASGVLTLSEDAGLEVTALNNEPGVYSARWRPGTHEDRYKAVLQALTGVADRNARFVAVVCVYDPLKKETHHFRGEVTGTIAPEARGTGGFGYDPIFIPQGSIKTFAELSAQEKQAVSHRRRALEQFVAWWRTRPEV